MSLNVKRHVLGVCALLLTIGGGWMWFVAEHNTLRMTANGCVRAGLTLGALWLALPQVLTITKHVSPRMLLAMMLGAVLVIVRPRTFPLVFLLLLAVGLIEFAGRFLRRQGKR